MASKVLTFDTQSVNHDLLPTKLEGTEGISMPYSYEVTLISVSPDVALMTNNPAASLIGSMALVGFLVGPNDTNYTHRTGMISKIEPEDRSAATSPGTATGDTSTTGDLVLGTGTGSGSRICYDPAEWPWQCDPASPTGARVLQALLTSHGQCQGHGRSNEWAHVPCRRRVGWTSRRRPPN